ncbi:P-II family nitrogen regulator [Deinococcus wulumuqiensis]|uniref:Nitrogen regulatory protein P-II n=1 Tax=Deinococcus wulumuqiensis TaxID=980427 RepID=A0AAV4K4I1_9DEIO|nr:P-II family nitrogen regulator [Deinococcus wulumuqiensis]QII20804.1 P-II family nitrogen regulator [Deinococcus wulumuqiensis R12]GGI80288.1 nitrogen regulatory protein P-II [Deinococcus wulumuqiensis]GGP29368.1 nitrogen regulatory protein P-II [Deinococcus wulumuqiensis]
MKLITAVVRPERVQQVKEALFQAGISGLTLGRVSGHGGEQELVEHYRGTRVMIEFRDKVELRMAVSEPFVEPAIAAICRSARTGEVGDGKIFVQPLERVVRIRTGEEDHAALTPVTESRAVPLGEVL